MEYGILIDKDSEKISCIAEYSKYVGYNTTNQYTEALFKKTNVDKISSEVTKALSNSKISERPILVPNKTICNVLSEVYDTYLPKIGDIMTRYVISPSQTDDYIRDIIMQTIEIIVSDVRNNLEMEKANNKLTIWTTVLGTFNPHGLRSHGPLKINNRHPNMMEFNMNY